MDKAGGGGGNLKNVAKHGTFYSPSSKKSDV